MSRVIQYRSLIAEVISRSAVCARQAHSHSIEAFAIKRGGISGLHIPTPERCKILYLSPPRAKFHTSVIQQSEEHGQPAVVEKEPKDDESSHTPVEESYSNERTVIDHEGTVGDPTEDNITARLRRLSMTYADDYQLSAKAQAKVIEMQKVRAETIKRGEQWKWDQQNLRPGGAPHRQSRYNQGRSRDYDDDRMNRFRYDEDDDFGGEAKRWSRGPNNFEKDRRWGAENFEEERGWRANNFSDNGRMRSSFNSTNARETFTREEFEEDTPDDYEVEMQKLRTRLKEHKVRKTASTNTPTDDDTRAESGRNDIRSTTSRVEHVDAQEQRVSFETTPDENPGYTGISDNYSPDHGVNFALAAGDPDTFGNLSFGSLSIVKDKVGEQIRQELLEEEKALSAIDEEEEEDDVRFIPPYGEKWTTDKLITKVRALLKEKKLKEAVDTYLGVLAQGGFHFNKDHIRHHFNVLINECAEVGYVDMAFRLFNLMKKRGNRERPRTISSLLNACANSPWDKEKNLDRIDKLLINVKDRGMELNVIHYHTLIKAYGRLGETVRAFHVVDKMLEDAKRTPTTSTFNMLMQACITDTKNGFRYTLITWRKLLSMGKMRPDIYSYNLLLRAVRDCRIEVDLKNIDLKAIGDDSTREYIETASFPLLPLTVTAEDSDRIFNFLISENSTTEEGQLVVNNLGDSAILDVKAFVKALSYPVNRMAVFGGIRGILSQMVRHRVAPNLKTLTAMLEVSRPDEIHDVLQLVKTYKIKPDVSFFNVAIKQCYMLNCHEKAKDILKVMNGVYNLTPNIATWVVLSMGCRTWSEAKTLLTEMENANFTPNIYILFRLIGSATRQFDPKYVLHLLEETKRRDIPIHEKYIHTVDQFIKTTQDNLVRHEMGKPVETKWFTHAMERNVNFGEHFALLKMRYGTWIHSVDVTIDPNNPWKEDFEYFNAHKKHKPEKTEDNRYDSLVDEVAENKV